MHFASTFLFASIFKTKWFGFVTIPIFASIQPYRVTAGTLNVSAKSHKLTCQSMHTHTNSLMHSHVP